MSVTTREESKVSNSTIVTRVELILANENAINWSQVMVDVIEALDLLLAEEVDYGKSITLFSVIGEVDIVPLLVLIVVLNVLVDIRVTSAEHVRV